MLACAATVAATAAFAIVAMAGVLVQPRFTVLELAAQRLVPDGQTAQPPVEQIERFAPFDRRYTVRFDTPDEGLQGVIDAAVRRRWHVVGRSGAASVTLEREGVRAVIVVAGDTTQIDTGIARSVRRRQQGSRLAALLAGAGWGAWWTWRQIRGQPRLRSVGRRAGE